MDKKEHIFGDSKLKKVKTGDLVRWHTLAKVKSSIAPEPTRSSSIPPEPSYKENIGIVINVLIERRGGRDVALARVIPLDPSNSNGTEIEVFLACLKVISPSVVASE